LIPRTSLYGCLKILLSALLLTALAFIASREFTDPAEATGATPMQSTCTRPSIFFIDTGTYWASFAEYQMHLLTVDYSIINNGGEETGGIWIAGSVNSNGVTQASSPYGVESITAGNSGTFTLQYTVPDGVQSFRNTVYATVVDLCGEVHEFPGPMPVDGTFTTWQWARPGGQTWLDAEGLHIYGGTTNRFKNPQLTDSDSDGVADGWQIANTSAAHSVEQGVEFVGGAGAGEQVIRLKATGSPGSSDWFGLWMKHNDANTHWALGADVRIDWLPGTTQQEKDALADLMISATAHGYFPRITLGKEDIGTGWRRVYANSIVHPANQDFYSQLRCQTSAGNWSSANGGLEIRFRRPQLENTLTLKGTAYTTPPAMPSEPGVFINEDGEPVRYPGYAQIGTVSEGNQDDSVFRLDSSKDWGMFVEWQPTQDAREIIANDNEWQMINLNNHWDWQDMVHNEIHIDVVGNNNFPAGENRVALLAWDANSREADWIFDSRDLTDIIRMGDVCRTAYWKSGGRHYVKLNVYRGGSLILSRMASRDSVVAQDLGILKQLTLGNTHMLMNRPQTHCSSGVFQHVSVEEASLSEAAVDTFLTSGIRPHNANSILWWDLSLGDRIFIRPR